MTEPGCSKNWEMPPSTMSTPVLRLTMRLRNGQSKALCGWRRALAAGACGRGGGAGTYNMSEKSMIDVWSCGPRG
jgi:hypothetical protein